MSLRMSDRYENEWIELEEVLKRFCIKYGFKPRAPLHDIASMVMEHFVKGNYLGLLRREKK